VSGCCPHPDRAAPSARPDDHDYRAQSRADARPATEQSRCAAHRHRAAVPGRPRSRAAAQAWRGTRCRSPGPRPSPACARSAGRGPHPPTRACSAPATLSILSPSAAGVPRRQLISAHPAQHSTSFQAPRARLGGHDGPLPARAADRQLGALPPSLRRSTAKTHTLDSSTATASLVHLIAATTLDQPTCQLPWAVAWRVRGAGRQLRHREVLKRASA
jgi:hypothetical protein